MKAVDCKSLFRILCKYLFSEVAVQADTELNNKYGADFSLSVVVQRYRHDRAEYAVLGDRRL
ncbi:hypothetical protein F6Z03_02705 [Salmonella enterica]|nr:hypothetical protein [Salmonella enterica]ECX9476497.1 hypothetical protein [Salmonella enterica]